MPSLRRLTQCFLLLTGILCLSACGHPAASSQAAHRTTITFWHGMTADHQAALTQLVNRFNRSQTRYRVVPVSQGNFGTLQQKITVAAKSDTLPTIAQTTYTNVPNYVQGHLVVPLDAYLGKRPFQDVVPVFRQSISYRGKSYAFPFSKSARILFYNRDLLKQQNVALPATWTALHQDGKRLKSQHIKALALDQSFLTELNDLTYQAGTPLITRGPRANLNTKQTRAATHVLWDMLQDHTATTAGNAGYGSTQFFAGKTLFYSGSSAAIPVMQASAPKGFHWGTTVEPRYHGRQGTSVSGNDIVLFKSASPAQRRGAAAFLHFLLQKKQTIQWAEKTGYLPLTTSACQDSRYQRYLARHPNARAAVQSLDFGFQDRAFQGYPQYFTAINQSLDQLTTTQTSPEQALPQLQQRVNTILRENRGA